MDPEYKERLKKDGATAAAELGISSDGWPPNGGVTGTRQCHAEHSQSGWFGLLISTVSPIQA